MASDKALLRRYAGNRDAEAFAELVRRYAGLVYAICLRITGSAHDAEDIAQECFMQLAQNAATIRSSLAGWLHAVAASRSNDAVRRAVARRLREGTAPDRDRDATGPTWSDIAPHVDQALEGLTEELSTPLVLHYLLGRTQRDVARELGVNQSAVSRRLKSGIAELRERLEKVGVVVPVALLAILLGENAGAAVVPATLTAALGKMALAGVGSPAVVAEATAGSAARSAVAALTSTKGMALTGIAVALLCAGAAVVYYSDSQESASAARPHANAPVVGPARPAEPARKGERVDPRRPRKIGPFIRWRYPIRNSVWGHSMKGDTLFFKDRGMVHAVNTQTGEALWTRRIDSMFVKGRLREVGNSVYALTKNRLLALDRATGDTRAEVPYETRFSDRQKWNSPHTLYVDGEERGAFAFCGPYHKGRGREYSVEVVSFDLGARRSSMKRMSVKYSDLVGGRHAELVWYATGLGRGGLDPSKVHAITLSDGEATALPQDAPQWGMSRKELHAASGEIYYYEWFYFVNRQHADGCVYLWEKRNTLEKRTREGELLWAHTSQEPISGFVGVCSAGAIICDFKTAVYCVGEGPAPAGEIPEEVF